MRMMRASWRLRYCAWIALVGAGACVRSDDVSLDRHVEGGDAARGRLQIVSYGCGS
ncbi:hypothetical protein BH09GEM1_BH09GEM1_09330 [soil metagenome]